MPSELLAEKYARLFRTADQDGDGREGLPEMLNVAAQVLTAFQASPTIGVGKAYLDGVSALWDALAKNHQPDALGRITVEQFQQAADTTLGSASGYDQVLAPLIEALLGMMDSDGDGVVGAAEFAKALEVLGVQPDHISAAFQALDQDGNGTVTTDQLRTAVREFFTSNDQSAPGNVILGPV